MTQQSKIRLLIADNHEMLRSGVKAMLTGTEIKVVAEVATGQAAVACALEYEVDAIRRPAKDSAAQRPGATRVCDVGRVSGGRGVDYETVNCLTNGAFKEINPCSRN